MELPEVSNDVGVGYPEILEETLDVLQSEGSGAGEKFKHIFVLTITIISTFRFILLTNLKLCYMILPTVSDLNYPLNLTRLQPNCLPQK